MNLTDIIDGQLENIDINTYAGKALIACRTKFKGVFGDNGLIGLNLVAFAGMIKNHDILASKGIFITDDNREEKYIEILEMDDPDLMDTLEEYIKYLDSTRDLEEAIKEYKDIVQRVQEEDSEDVEAINAIVKDYLNK